MITNDKYLYFLYCGNDSDKSSTNYKFIDELVFATESKIKRGLANSFDSYKVSYTNDELDVAAKDMYTGIQEQLDFLRENFDDGDVIVERVFNIPGVFYYANNGDLYFVNKDKVTEVEFSHLANYLKHSSYTNAIEDNKRLIKFDKTLYSKNLQNARKLIAYSSIGIV